MMYIYILLLDIIYMVMVDKIDSKVVRPRYVHHVPARRLRFFKFFVAFYDIKNR